MSQTINRKSAPGVKDGKVQKKNRHALSPDIYEHEFDSLVVKRLRPSKGYYHAVSPTDVRRFIALIPDWAEASEGIKAIVFTPGGDWAYGRYNNAGIIKLDAWPKVEPFWPSDRKEWLLEQIGVQFTQEDGVLLNPSQVRAFLLLGTFLHELGHHVNRMSTRSKWDAANGEPAAIAYELRRQRELLAPYLETFGVA